MALHEQIVLHRRDNMNEHAHTHTHTHTRMTTRINELDKHAYTHTRMTRDKANCKFVGLAKTVYIPCKFGDSSTE